MGRSGVSKWVFRRRVALQPCLSSFVRYATKTGGGSQGVKTEKPMYLPPQPLHTRASWFIYRKCFLPLKRFVGRSVGEKTRGGRRGQPAMSERREVAKLGKQGKAL